MLTITLKKEIILLLLLKVVLLFVLYKLFFSQPIEPQLTSQKVAQHFLTPEGSRHD